MKAKAKSKVKRRIYLDYTSSTPVDPKVSLSMKKIEKLCVGNPNALHEEGRNAKKIYENARKSLAENIGAKSDEIIFTSGATESNNLAILGLYESLKDEYKKAGKTPHIISSSIEHKSVLEVLKHLESKGVKVTYIEPEKDGTLPYKIIRKSLTPDTMLVTIMHANNEIGTINDIEEIVKEVRHARRKLGMTILGTPYFHTDAAQSVTYVPIDMEKIGIDLLTHHSPKIYGPAGVGLLYKRRGVNINPIIFGGGQEEGLRSGRELPILAHGFAEAFSIAKKEMNKEMLRLTKLRDYFFNQIQKIIPSAKINGTLENRLPNNVNVCIPNIDAEFAVICLDENGIACSSASTCMNTSDESYSYVIERIYGDRSCAASSLRFSLGRYTTKSEIGDCLKILKKVLLLQWNPVRSRDHD
ncbi:MAG: cysteine desulfurase family protein [Patescibacteria group bacterium]